MSHLMLRSRRSLASSLVALMASLALAGCGNDDNPVSPGGAGSTTFQGTIAGPSTSGTLSLTVATTSLVPQPGSTRSQHEAAASGTLRLSSGGADIPLTGTYHDEEDEITVTGGGWTLIGTVTAFGMQGTFAGPSGESGVFTVQTRGTGADTVRVFIGTFTSTSGGESGVFNFGIRGAVVHGTAVSSGNSVIPVVGTYTSSNDSLKVVHPENPTGPPLAAGMLHTGGHVSGTYDTQTGNSGTWSGQKSN